uniref:Cytochrome b n=1 Tax=Monomachus antipodalis TaxID=161211 RepID=A0A0E3I859_9HYME|nr:cytochrome b [Monomachus antipodalis]
MKKSIFKNYEILNLIKISLLNLPTPMNISMWWNFGSLLGFCLMIQIITGLILSMHYCCHINMAFDSLIHIIQDVNYGWLFRLMHMNGASMFFICIYIHIGRGLYYNSYILMMTWIMGVLILFLLMAIAFMGYVLPWGQMSLWGATVITNLVSAIPFLGDVLVQWLWGGFSVGNPTLNRFYSFHFFLPFILIIFVVLHLMFLHLKGSSNPLGLNSNLFKISFHPYYSFKDLIGFLLIFMIFMLIIMINPYILSDPENFIKANSMITPKHIQPEWYFLFAYAILRSIPNKLGGVFALIMSILILIILPFLKVKNMQSNKFYFLNQIFFWIFVVNFILLTWIGAKSIEEPFIIIGQVLTFLYFSYYLMNSFMMKLWDKLIF